jgi:hypothetical protein
MLMTRSGGLPSTHRERLEVYNKPDPELTASNADIEWWKMGTGRRIGDCDVMELCCCGVTRKGARLNNIGARNTVYAASRIPARVSKELFWMKIEGQ